MTNDYDILRLCCLYRWPFGRTGPWRCPDCWLLHAIKCEPEPAAETSPMDISLARDLGDVMRGDLPYDWTDRLIDSFVDSYAEIEWRAP